MLQTIFMQNCITLEKAYQLYDRGYSLIFFKKNGLSLFKLIKEA